MNLKEEQFNVMGMSCAACQANVTKAVKKLEGISDVDVSLLGNSMKVEYDEEIVDVDQIISAVEKVGYGASLKNAQVSGKKNSLRDQWDARQKRIEEASKKARYELIVSVIIMIPLMYIAMGEMLNWPMPSCLIGMENMMVNTLVQLIMASIIMIIQKHFYIDGFKGLIHKAPNMDSLVALGSTASYLYALAMTFIMAASMGKMDMETAHMAAHALYYDSAAMIVTLVSIGKYLESRSKAKTGDALGKLMDLTPKNATVIRNGKQISISSEDVIVGDIVVVRPGQRIPVDGVVVEGNGYVNQSAITGESIPVEKNVGDTVLSATMNENGSFQFRAEKVGDDTTLAQIIRLVDEAGTSKAEIARVADTVAGVFVPIVIGIAIVTFIGWMLVSQDFQTALNNSISVLVISCPCALGLATPMAIMVGTEKAARYGILLKNAQSLENLHKINTIVLDKTGTITSGKPSVQNIVHYTDMAEDEFLQLAASIETGSQHPLALAIVQKAQEKGISFKEVSSFENKSGLGIEASVDGILYSAGNQRMMEEAGIEISDTVIDDINTLATQGKTPILFSDDTQVLGIIAVADTVRNTSKQAIQAFKEKGIHVVMLTGDHAQTAQAIAKDVGVDEVISEVLPADKEAHVRRLQEEGRFVAMVGDGINDAPALVRADIGIAIGQGTDIAMDSSDVVLMKNSLLDVDTAIDLSSAVIRNVKQNLFWAFFYNVIGIPLAMGILTPLTGWSMSPMYGSAAMSLSSIFVCTNACRLSWFQSKHEDVHDKEETKEIIVPKEEPNIQATIQADGMMCQHCVASVTKALNNLPGVKVDSINLDEKTVYFKMDENVSSDVIKQAITEAGYTPYDIKKEDEEMLFGKKEKQVVEVPDMMCQHCVKHVTQALESIGAKNIQVDLDSKKATFVGDVDKAKQAITEAGYKVQ